MSDDRVLVILRQIADGNWTARSARPQLWGLKMPNQPAQLIKDGRWASEGGYPSGEKGLRLAARDALALVEDSLA